MSIPVEPACDQQHDHSGPAVAPYQITVRLHSLSFLVSRPPRSSYAVAPFSQSRATAYRSRFATITVSSLLGREFEPGRPLARFALMSS